MKKSVCFKRGFVFSILTPVPSFLKFCKKIPLDKCRDKWCMDKDYSSGHEIKTLTPELLNNGS